MRVCVCVRGWGWVILATLSKDMDYYISISTLHTWLKLPEGLPFPSPLHHPPLLIILLKLTSCLTFLSFIFTILGQIISESTFNVFVFLFSEEISTTSGRNLKATQSFGLSPISRNHLFLFPVPIHLPSSPCSSSPLHSLDYILLFPLQAFKTESYGGQPIYVMGLEL